MKTKKVRILKDGEAQGITYLKGEIWEFIHYYGDRRFCKIKNNQGKCSQVTLEEVSPYGLEAEIIEEDVIEQSKELTINLW